MEPAVTGVASSTSARAAVVLPVLTAFFGIAVSMSFGRFSLGLLAPDMRDSIGLGYTGIGLLISANLAGYLIGVLLVPWLATRFVHIRLVQFGIALATCGMGLIAAPTPVPMLVVAVVATGFSGSFAWICASAIGHDVSRERNLGLVLGVIGSANGIGIVVASMLALVLERADGSHPWRLVWLVQAAIGLASLLVCLGAPPGRPQPKPAGSRREGPSLLALTLGFALFGAAYAWFATYYVATASERSHVNGPVAWAMVGVGAVLGSSLFGLAADRWGAPIALVASPVTGTIACVVMVAMRTGPATLVAGLLFGAAVTSVGAVLPAIVTGLVGRELLVPAYSSLVLAFGGVQVLAPTPGGLLVDHVPHGFELLYVGSAVAFVITALLFSHSCRPLRAARVL
jgi:MFS family permease